MGLLFYKLREFKMVPLCNMRAYFPPKQTAVIFSFTKKISCGFKAAQDRNAESFVSPVPTRTGGSLGVHQDDEVFILVLCYNEMLFSFKNKYHYTYLNVYIALYFSYAKVTCNTHKQPKEFSFQPSYARSLISQTTTPFHWESCFHPPKPVIPDST